MNNQTKTFKIVSTIVVIAFMLIMIFPFFWILITSFKPNMEIHGLSAFKIISDNPTIENYTTVVEKGMLNSIKNSFIVSIITTLYVVAVSTLCSYILARTHFKGKKLLMGAILAVSMFPQMVVVGPIFNMFYKLKLLNSYWVCLAYSSITLPAATWIMVAHFKKIPLALEEAAHMDGCNAWQTLWKVIFPVALPGVFTCAIMTFISAWNEYLLTYTLNADKAFQTVPVGINALRTQFAILWGEITAATIVVVIPTLIIVLLFQKQIISGMTSGAVKE